MKTFLSFVLLVSISTFTVGCGSNAAVNAPEETPATATGVQTEEVFLGFWDDTVANQDGTYTITILDSVYVDKIVHLYSIFVTKDNWPQPDFAPIYLQTVTDSESGEVHQYIKASADSPLLQIKDVKKLRME